MENVWIKVAEDAKGFGISFEEYELLKEAAAILSKMEGEENEGN